MTKPNKTIARTPKNPEATKKKLLDAALMVFSRTGYSAAKLEDIAKEAGVTRGAISYHFQNKETVAYILIKQIFDSDLYNLIQIYKSEGSPGEVLKKAIHLLIKDREMKHKEVSLYNNLLYEDIKDRAELLEYVDSVFEQIFEIHGNLIKKGILEGCFKPNIDAHFETRFFYNFFWGFFTTQFRFFSSYSEEDLNAHLKENVITRILI